MKEGFEKVFSNIQANMVEACLEYVSDKADKIYIYASYEAKTLACNFYYEINGQIYKKHKLPEGYDISVDRQMSCLDKLLDEMQKLIGACKEYETEMPTEIKMVYDVKHNNLNADYRYDIIFSNTKKSANDIAEEWYNQLIG